ncbi:MAG: DUF5668 domain-containing protein [Chloroflexota bacterium]
MNERRQTATWGIILIVVGVLALLGALGVRPISMQNLWPLLMIAGGVAILISGFTKDPHDTGNVWFGLMALLCGGLFAYITLGAGEWSDLRTLWPIFPGMGAVAWLVAWAVDLRQISNLVSALVSGAVAVVGYLYTTGRVEGSLIQSLATYWPLILVLIGAGLIAQFFVQRR